MGEFVLILWFSLSPPKGVVLGGGKSLAQCNHIMEEIRFEDRFSMHKIEAWACRLRKEYENDPKPFAKP